MRYALRLRRGPKSRLLKAKEKKKPAVNWINAFVKNTSFRITKVTW